MSNVDIHEDDEGVRDVYPTDAISDAMVDMDTAKATSVENLAPNGVG